jgi:hypothetical protein
MIKGNVQDAYQLSFREGQVTMILASSEEQARSLASYHFPSLSIVSIKRLGNNGATEDCD